MSASEIPTARTDNAKHVNFWKKAVEFRSAMRRSLGSGEWNGAALNAVHAAISANDALLVCFHGVRSISPKHDDAIKFLQSLVKHEGAAAGATHLRKLLNTKHLVEYEGRLFTRSEADMLAKHAERFTEWVESMLPKA